MDHRGKTEVAEFDKSILKATQRQCGVLRTLSIIERMALCHVCGHIWREVILDTCLLRIYWCLQLVDCFLFWSLYTVINMIGRLKRPRRTFWGHTPQLLVHGCCTNWPPRLVNYTTHTPITVTTLSETTSSYPWSSAPAFMLLCGVGDVFLFNCILSSLGHNWCFCCCFCLNRESSLLWSTSPLTGFSAMKPWMLHTWQSSTKLRVLLQTMTWVSGIWLEFYMNFSRN